MMITNEFNLSVLENVTEFVSPLKNGSEYEVILGLIQQEFEMQTENETDLQKVSNSLNLVSEKKQHSDIHNDENFSKSPDNMKSSSRLKSRASLLKNCRSHEKERNQSNDESNLRKGRSLGAVKPRRSLNLGSKIRNVCARRSLETPLNFDSVNVSESHDKILENRDREENPSDGASQGIIKFNQAPFVNTNSRDQTSALAETENNEKTLQTVLENPQLTDSSQLEPVVLKLTEPCSPEKSQDTDFVESSQSTTNSSLRQKLHNLRRSPANQSVMIERKSTENQQNGSVLSEDEDRSVSLNFPPGFKSKIGNEREESVTPPVPRKRKVSPLEFYEIVSSKHQKIYSSNEEDDDLSDGPENNPPKKKQKLNSSKQKKIALHKKPHLQSLKTRQNETSSLSPLKGLSQELKHCIGDSDYNQMTENLKKEMLDATNFSFETIELLNDYDDSNEKTNNQILSRIFSSSSLEIKNEPLDHSDASAFHEQLADDPLDFEGRAVSSPTKNNKKTLVVGKRSVKKSPRVSNKFLMKQIEGTQNFVSISSKARNSMNKSGKMDTEISSGILKYLIRPRRSPRKSLSESITEEKGIENKGRRSSTRSESPTPSESNSSELEDDLDLAEEAADISRKIEAAQQNSRLPDEALNILKNLEIQLRHDVLPQHNIERKATSKHLTLEERKKFIKFAPLNKDNYSAAEDELIKANWQAFCKDHDWEPTNYEAFLNFKHGDELIMSLKERRKFVQYLADGLPNRPLYSVYSRFKRLFRKPPSNGTRYTPDEDAQILAYMLHVSAESREKKCYELSKILGRKRESISSRFKKLKEKYFPTDKKNVLTKVEWNLCLVEEYIRTLFEVTLSEDLMELKDAFIPKVVWLKMEQKMKIEWQILSRFWEQQLHLQLFVTQPIYLNEIKTKLIEHIYSSNISHPMDIKWNNVLRHFDGFTTYFLRKTFNHLTCQTSKILHTRHFKRIMDWLHTVKTHQLANSLRDKCLPRILYRNKKAEFVVEDIERIQSFSRNNKTD